MMKRIALILALSLLPGVALADETDGKQHKYTFKTLVPEKVTSFKQVDEVKIKDEGKEKVLKQVEEEKIKDDGKEKVYKHNKLLYKRLTHVLNKIRYKLYIHLSRGNLDSVKEFIDKLEKLANEIPPVNKPPSPTTPPGIPSLPPVIDSNALTPNTSTTQ